MKTIIGFIFFVIGLVLFILGLCTQHVLYMAISLITAYFSVLGAS